MRPTWTACLVVVTAAACGGGGAADDTRETDRGGVAQSLDPGDANDPCTLVSAGEMERFLGPLAEPPYRVRQRKPAPEGDGCMYRARDGRNVTLEVDFEDGPLVYQISGAGTAVEDLLGGRDMSADTVEVPWEEAALSFGRLIALSGNTFVALDPLASRLDLAQMAEVVAIALGRAGSPLSYDGAEPARALARRPPRRGDPCSLLTRPEVEAAMGKLRADPHPDEDGAGCVYPLDMEFFGEPVDRLLEVRWDDGFHALGEERQAMSMAGGAMATFVSGADTPELGSAVSDEGPWDERVTLLGGVVTVVKRDVLLKIAADGMGGFDESRALDLLRVAVGRIE